MPPVAQSVRIEVVPPRWQRFTMWGFVGVAAVAVAIIVYASAEEGDVYLTWFVGVMAAFLVFCCLLAFQVGSRRLVLVGGELRYTSWLRNWVLPTRAVVGYRDVSLYGDGDVDRTMMRARIEATIDGKRVRRTVNVNAEMATYLSERFDDLAALEAVERRAELLRDERLGATEEARAANLERAGSTVWLASLVALGTFFAFLIFYVRGWVLHLAGFVTLLLVLYAVVRHRGAVSFEWRGVRSGLLTPTVLGAAAVFFGAQDYGQEAFLPFWREGLAVAAVGSVLYWRFCAHPVGTSVGQLVQWVAAPLGFFLLTGALGQAIDGLVAVGEAEVASVPIERLKVKDWSRGPDTYALHFDRTGAWPLSDTAGRVERGINPDTDVEIPLDYATYARLREGQRIEVHRYTGAFGLRSHVAYDEEGRRLNGHGTILTWLRWVLG